MGLFSRKKGGTFFGNLLRGAGRFAKKIVSSGVGKTILGIAATVVGGPLAGAGVVTAIKALGKTKVGEMAAKVIDSGVVKVDKIIETLDRKNVERNPHLVEQIALGLKNAAQGISHKSISVSHNPSTYRPSSKAQSVVVKISFLDRLKGYYTSAVEWLRLNKKKAAIYGGVALVLIIGGWYLLGGSRKKWRV